MGSSISFFHQSLPSGHSQLASTHRPAPQHGLTHPSSTSTSRQHIHNRATFTIRKSTPNRKKFPSATTTITPHQADPLATIVAPQQETPLATTTPEPLPLQTILRPSTYKVSALPATIPPSTLSTPTLTHSTPITAGTLPSYSTDDAQQSPPSQPNSKVSPLASLLHTKQTTQSTTTNQPKYSSDPKTNQQRHQLLKQYNADYFGSTDPLFSATPNGKYNFTLTTFFAQAHRQSRSHVTLHHHTTSYSHLETLPPYSPCPSTHRLWQNQQTPFVHSGRLLPYQSFFPF